MFNPASVAIAILDDKLRILSANPAYCALTGYAADELIGLPFETAGERAAGRAELKRKDGTIAQIEWQIAQDGISPMRVLVAADLSRQMQSACEGLLTTLSHELRNPLNAILGWATVLSRKASLPEPVMQGLQAIERNARIQARMISELTDYAGITCGKMCLAVETLDPYPIVQAALETVSEQARAAGALVQAKFDDESLRIEADPARLQQIVWTLLTNAIKFSAKGGAVEVTAARRADWFQLVVRDHGKGIESEFLPHIFDCFNGQAVTATDNHGGLKLGLAIAKQLILLHGGTIHAASGGNRTGATFTVEIPLRPPT
jgi:signal transduction histidine kinase